MMTPRVGVGVLVMDELGRVLLSLRRKPPEAGAWSILGGRVEAFERLEACARREAREEAGVDVQIERLLCVTDHIVREESEHWVAPAYLAHIVSGNVENREPHANTDVRWYDVNQLPDRLTITARAAINALLLEPNS